VVLKGDGKKRLGKHLHREKTNADSRWGGGGVVPLQALHPLASATKLQVFIKRFLEF